MEDIAEEKRLQEEYASRMKDGFSVLKNRSNTGSHPLQLHPRDGSDRLLVLSELRYLSEDDLRVTFLESDPDHSGQIDDRELKAFFDALNVAVRNQLFQNSASRAVAELPPPRSSTFAACTDAVVCVWLLRS